ncbi:hypothetical protein ACOZ35_01855 [Halorubrum xinjiangense]|uniref:hypothetical protein n=1 Tax=Halorubrum xinjiangense TaxID=261291 RepID=UPI003C6EB010
MLAPTRTSPPKDFEAVTGTLVETASVLPNTSMGIAQDGSRAVAITCGGGRRYDDIVEKVRRLTHRYERLIVRRERAQNQSADADFDDYHADSDSNA